MNGRMYDPMVGRFLSADPVLQAPGNFQNYNRYSYCLNNPMKYTAPTGYQVYNYGTTWSSNLRTDVSGGSSSSRMGSELGTIYNSNGEFNYRDPYSQEVLGAYYESDAESLSDFIVGRYYKKYVEGVDKSYIVMNNTLYSIEHVSLGVTLVSLDVASSNGGGNGYSEALYLANTINSLYDENATRNLKTLEREAQAWKNVARKVPGRINKAMDANKFTKVITKNVGKKLYGVGLVFSAVDMYQDPSASNIAWNVADNLVGLAAFVPGLQVPALIYFTARISYDVYDAYNEP